MRKAGITVKARIVIVLILALALTISYTGTLNAESREGDFSVYAGTGFLPAGEHSTFGWKGGLEFRVNPRVSMMGDAAFYSQKVDVTDYYSADLDLSIFRASGGYEVASWGNDLSRIMLFTGLGIYRVTALGNTENEFGLHLGTDIKQHVIDDFKLRGSLSYTHGVDAELLDEGLIEISGAITYDF